MFRSRTVPLALLALFVVLLGVADHIGSRTLFLPAAAGAFVCACFALRLFPGPQHWRYGAEKRWRAGIAEARALEAAEQRPSSPPSPAPPSTQPPP